MPNDLTLWKWLAGGGATLLLTAIGYLVRQLVIEKRRNRAIDKQEEAKARHLETTADGAEVINFGTLVEKAEQVFNNTLHLQRQLLDCEKKTGEQERQISERDRRIGELEATERHLKDTLKAEILKTAAKEDELVDMRRQKQEMEDRFAELSRT